MRSLKTLMMDRSKFRESDTIYDVYHTAVIVHFHKFWCGHTVARLTWQTLSPKDRPGPTGPSR